MERPLPSGRRLEFNVFAAVMGVALPIVPLIAVYLWGLLRLPREQWVAILWFIAFALPLVLVNLWLFNRYACAPIVGYLTRHATSTANRHHECDAFARVMLLPRLWFFMGALVWPIIGGSLAFYLARRFEGFPPVALMVIVAATLTGGFVVVLANFVVVKILLAPLRHHLARKISDPDLRARLTPGLGLFTKLTVVVVGATVVVVLFNSLVARLRLEESIEATTVRFQQGLLRRLVFEQAAAVDADVQQGRELARSLGIADDVLVIDGATGKVLAGEAAALTPLELRYIKSSTSAEGDSRALNSPHIFAWASLGRGGSTLVASLPADLLQASVAELQRTLLLLLVICAVLSAGFSYMVAREVVDPVRTLRREVVRMASGDLRPGEPIETEDEVGTLAHAFERMASALGGMVQKVAGTAEQVDGQVRQLGQVAQKVARASQDQGIGVRAANQSIQEISSQAQQIAGSAQDLGVSATGSVDAAATVESGGGRLSQNAVAFAAGVQDVTRAMGEMTDRVQVITSQTEMLAAAAEEVASAMAQTAAAMKQAEQAAGDTAHLGEEVVVSAEVGRDTVRKASAGMLQIRATTGMIEDVVRRLGERVEKIGSILGVINKVAAQTKLLSLNASIIAAQAGEHGRGFAVVADEIKSLAGEVSDSTREIAALISALQEESAKAIEAIGQGVTSVASGVEQSTAAGEALERITSASQKSRAHIAAIVTAVREQSRAATHVAHRMEEVRSGLAGIRRAAEEHAQGNATVAHSAQAMGQGAQDMSLTTGLQATSAQNIRRRVDEVRQSVGYINSALQQQSAALQQALRCLEDVAGRTHDNEESVRGLTSTSDGLRAQADLLRREVSRFRLE